MGREVKRVPMNFDWPIRSIWKGYLNPYFVQCPKCDNGYSEAYKIIEKSIQELMWGNKEKNQSVEAITTFLAGRKPSYPFGHDSIDMWKAIKKLGELAGLEENWIECDFYHGDGCHPDHFEKYNSWEPEEPPVGEGWQMWETTSEGSPISPVFSTPEGLARWLVDNKASSFGSSTATYEQWLTMITSDGFAVSMVVDSNGMRSGVEFVSEQEPK